MVKVRGPLLSIEAHGWLGGYFYQTHFVNPFPYPISLLGRIRVPYSLWDRGIHGMYRIPAFAVFPYPGFISQYYSPTGWVYEQRRTWHGMQPTIRRAVWPLKQNVGKNDVYNQRFKNAILAWHALTQEEKDIYNKMKYPRRMQGVNRFIKLFIKSEPLPSGAPSYILVESGSKLLVEAGSGLLVSG
jgi:hypothetical protein